MVPVAVTPARVVRFHPERRGRGHHIARSTMIGTSLVLVTVADRAALGQGLADARELLFVHPDVEAALRGNEVRLREHGSVAPADSAPRPMRAVVAGLAISMNSSKYGPVAPSARNQLQRRCGHGGTLVPGVEQDV